MVLKFILTNATYIFLVGYIVGLVFGLNGKEVTHSDGWFIGGILFCLYSIDALNNNLNYRCELLEEMKETLDRMKDKLDAE